MFAGPEGSLEVVWKSWFDRAPTLRQARFDRSGQLTSDRQYPMPPTAEELVAVLRTDAGLLASFEENYTGRDDPVDYLHLIWLDRDGEELEQRTLPFDDLVGTQLLGLDPDGRVLTVRGLHRNEQEAFEVLVGDPRFERATP